MWYLVKWDEKIKLENTKKGAAWDKNLRKKTYRTKDLKGQTDTGQKFYNTLQEGYIQNNILTNKRDYKVATPLSIKLQ